MRQFLYIAVLLLFAKVYTPCAAQQPNKPLIDTVRINAMRDSAGRKIMQVFDIDMLSKCLQVKQIENVRSLSLLELNKLLKDTIEAFRTGYGTDILVHSFINSTQFWPTVLFNPNRLSRDIGNATKSPAVGFGVSFTPYGVGSQRKFAIDITNQTTPKLLDENQLNQLKSVTKYGVRGQFKKIAPDAKDSVNASLFRGIATLRKFWEQELSKCNIQSVTFTPIAKPNYGFDREPSELLKTYYESMVVRGKSYNVPWKSLEAGKTDEVTVRVALADSKGATHKVNFRREKGSPPVVTPNGDGTFTLTLTGGSNKDEEIIEAYYTDTLPGGKTKETVVGKLKVKTYSPTQKKVIPVILNGSPWSMGATELTQALNDIYKQAAVSFTVAEPMRISMSQSEWDVDEADGVLLIETSPLRRYSTEMQAIIDKIKDQSGYDSEACYAVITDLPNSEGYQGYMPLKSDFSFIFTKSNPDYKRVVPHELGHGVFYLKHPQDEYKILDATNNLMDKYNPGLALWKPQWDWIGDPSWRLYAFQEESDGASIRFVNVDEAKGIDCFGRIIAGYRSNSSDKYIVPCINNQNLYVIVGFNVYDKISKTKERFVSCNEFNDPILTVDINNNDNKKVPVFQLTNDNCTYQVQEIDWEYKANINVVEEIKKKIISDKWRIKGSLNNADISCFLNFIISHDGSAECLDPISINNDNVRLSSYFGNKGKDEDLVYTINTICKSAIKKCKYKEIEELFERLAKSESIKNEKEIAILRLMSSINSTDYSEFYNLLEKESNKLIKNLVSKISDSAFPWGDDNFKNFTGGLVQMFKVNPDSYLNRIGESGSDKLVGQVINLNPKPFISDVASIPLAGFLPLNEFKFEGTYKSETGEINLLKKERILANGIPVWAKEDSDPGVNFSPLTPIVITAKGELPIVETALGEPIVDSEEDLYVVPAIFLKYKGDKEFNHTAGQVGMITLDAITIYASGGTMLATKVHWVRRLWALAEVAGAVTNIGITTGTIQNEYIEKANTAFNIGMGIIGIKNLGKGIVNYAKVLGVETKNLIKTNKNIRALILSSYINWKVALKDLGEITPAERKLVTEQDEVYRMMGVADKTVDGKHISWEEAVKISNASKAFNHVPTSGAVVTNSAKSGTFLVGSYPTDLQYILSELNYPKILKVDFAFPVPSGQKFNLLNVSDAEYNYWTANGGFFTKVNGPWIDAAVLQNADIVVVSKADQLYNSPGVLSGFGKEIHRLEWKHGYRFDPTTKMMVPPSKAAGLQTLTLKSEYTHI